MESQTQDLNQVVNSIKINARNMSVWLKLVGVINILSGAAAAISIIGIIIAWVPIWMGVLLFQAGSRADEAQFNNQPELIPIMLDKLRLYFLIQGILVLIGIGFTILGIFIFGLSLAPLLENFSH